MTTLHSSKHGSAIKQCRYPRPQEAVLLQQQVAAGTILPNHSPCKVATSCAGPGKTTIIQAKCAMTHPIYNWRVIWQQLYLVTRQQMAITTNSSS